MDLRAILTSSDNGGDRASATAVVAAATPKQQQQQQQRPQPPVASPATPGQAAPPGYSFREYGHPPHASPGRPGPPPPQDYGQPPPSQYPPQSPYQTPGPYPGRHAPPPLQPTPYNDPRSPGGAPMPGPSPYRQTPTGSISGPSGGYPFPPTQMAPQEMTSPVQRHQIPPSNAYPPRDAYPQQVQVGPPVGVTGPHGAPSYMQQQHPMPQTPPIGTPGAAHPYLHQRSQSTHSTPTPTSAQSQQQYGPLYGSPVATTHPLPGEYNRQQSQPPTPLGPPPSAGPRQSTGTGNFAQPPSPHQQRMSSSASSALHHQAHASPPPPPPPALPRLPSNSHSAYDPHVAESHRRSQSRSERDRSVSVSPKTRIPTLPTANSRQGSIIETDFRLANLSVVSLAEPDRLNSSAKRKLDDRDLRPEEMERREPRPPPGVTNGAHVPVHRPQRTSTSPLLQRKKRVRHREPPVWAESSDGRTLGESANFVLHKHRPPSVNGKHESISKQERVSRHTSPETSRSTVTVQVPEPPPRPESLLGAWEPSITGAKPYDEISRRVADFLFVNVIAHPDSGEIHSRGIQFEIEAKLGTLIDKDTNYRVYKQVDTECLLHDTGRVAFKSSMTEVSIQP
jgi:hypothetical protein